MKTRFILGVIGLFFVLAFGAAYRAFDDTAAMLKKIGMSDEDAKQNIWSGISGKYMPSVSSDVVKALAKGNKAALVEQIAGYAKTYSRSDEFKRQYLQRREDNKPEPPPPYKTTAQARAEYKHQMDSTIKETEKMIQQLTKDQQEALKSMIQAMREQRKAADDPNNPMFSPQMEEMGKQMYAASVEEHKKKMEEWKKDWPESPTPMVRAFLEKFLEETADVDYSAKLINGPDGKKLFASTENELKPDNWKRCYRAGKETVDAGRKAAQEWLKELNAAK